MITPVDLALNPYLALGLRGNPFIGEEQRPMTDNFWVDRGWSQPPTNQAKQLIQVIGNKGFGKTSHLKHWQSQTGGPYCYYPPGWRRCKFPPVTKIAYWDEANRIPIPFLFIALAWAAVTSATIVVGTHADLGNIATRLGLKVTTISLPPQDLEALLIWANSQIEAARLPEIPCSLILTSEKAAEILAIAHGSWRTASDYLHIWAAKAANREIL